MHVLLLSTVLISARKMCAAQVPMTITLTLVSFGYRNGAPQDTQANYSVRHLPGASRAARASNNTGLRVLLQKELFGRTEVQQYYDNVLLPSLQKHVQQLLSSVQKATNGGAEQKNLTASTTNVRIGIGCEIGRHRSVAIVERLVGDLRCSLGKDGNKNGSDDSNVAHGSQTVPVPIQFTVTAEHRDLGSEHRANKARLATKARSEARAQKRG